MLPSRTLKKDMSLEETQFVSGFPKKGVSIIASKPGVGKTWYMLNIISTLAQKEIKTCSFIGDCPPNVLYDRINKLTDLNFDPNIAKMYFLTDAVKNKMSMILTQEEGLHNFCEVIHNERPELVFIDTFSSLTDIEESSQKDTAELFQKLIIVAEKYNCAIIINHHLRKSSRKERFMNANLDDIIGSSIITRLASVALILNKDASTGRVLISVAKTWYQDDTFNGQSYKVVNNDDGSVKILTVYMKENTSYTEGKKAMLIDWIVNFYASGTRGNIFVVDVPCAELNIGSQTVREILNTLLAEKDPIITSQTLGASKKKLYIIVDKNIKSRYNDAIIEIQERRTPNGGNRGTVQQQSQSQAQ